MSLYKQLWLAIAFLMSLALAGSFIVGCLSAKIYLEEQLYRKNIDNASSLALSLSAQARDKMMTELFINSQFDTGHYQFINLVDLNGNTIAAQFDNSHFFEAPAWLISLFPINAKPGVAQVSNGWQQIATLTLSSHTKFAYRQLWDNAKLLFYYFALMSLVSGVLGSVLLRVLTRPLHKAVDHAKAISERRFITTEEPYTLEFRAVIRSMNTLSEHVKSMLHEESSKLEKWRKDMQHDKVTGLLNREPILNHLDAFLQHDDENSDGAIILVRIAELYELNQQLGRSAIDILLNRFGELLQLESKKRTQGLGIAGRLSGSDFVILLPGKSDIAENKGRQLHENLKRICRENGMDEIKLYAASTVYHPGESAAKIIQYTESILANSSSPDSASCVHIEPSSVASNKLNTHNWQQYLVSALDEKRFQLEYFPVHSRQENLLHLEAPVRLVQEDNSLINAGKFMPHISRLGLGTRLDLLVTELALKEIERNKIPVGINFSSSLLNDPPMIAKISETIKRYSTLAERLWLEVPEYGVFQNIKGFGTLCQSLKPLNCKIGIEHVGQEIRHIGKLHDLGLDYVKIDRSIIHSINTKTSYQVLVRGLCTIVHSIGLQAIAEGVDNYDDWQMLIELGVDGGTGKYFSTLNKQ